MIIDCHVHLNRYGDEHSEDLRERYLYLRSEMDLHGVDYALVLTSYLGNHNRPDVHQVLEAVDGDPHIGVVAAVSYLNYRAADLADLRGC